MLAVWVTLAALVVLFMLFVVFWLGVREGIKLNNELAELYRADRDSRVAENIRLAQRIVNLTGEEFYDVYQSVKNEEDQTRVSEDA